MIEIPNPPTSSLADLRRAADQARYDADRLNSLSREALAYGIRLGNLADGDSAKADAYMREIARRT